jgi:hypothetical protein
MISLCVDKKSDAATMERYHLLDKMDLPEDVHITINNLAGAESGMLRRRVGFIFCHPTGQRPYSRLINVA